MNDIPIDPALAFLSSVSSIEASRGTSHSVDPTGYHFLGNNQVAGIQGSNDDLNVGGSGGGGNKSKKRAKQDSGDDESGKAKKTRQTQSCDACRARKVKCDRPPPSANSDGSQQRDICSHCESLNLACTFDYVPKKRGPPNLYLRKLQDGESPSTPNSSRKGSPVSGKNPLNDRSPAPPSFSLNSSTKPGTLINPYAPCSGMLSSYSQSSDTSNDNGRYMSAQFGRDVEAAWEPSLLMAIAATAPNETKTQPVGPGSSPINATSSHPATSAGPPSVALSASPAWSPYASFPHNPNNPFDAIIPRGMLYLIIDIYFDYIHALIPCVHKPSFMADLHAGREERPGEEEWRTLVLTIVSATLVQIPCAFVPYSRREVKALVDKITLIVKDYLMLDYEKPTIHRCLIMYLFVYHAVGNRAMGLAALHGCVSIITLLSLHEEETYQRMNPIEREISRRIYWLVYGGEKTIAVVDTFPIMMNEDDYGDVGLPAELDDEYITSEQYLSQPTDKPSLMTGFCYISKLFDLIGRVLRKRRSDRRQNPTGLVLQMRLNEVMAIYDQVCHLMDDCPEVLRLDSSEARIKEDWDATAFADVRRLFLDPRAPKAIVKDAFLVQQGNIHVTQQMARQLILQYRDELLELQAQQLSSTRSGWGSLPADNDDVASDLLNVLQSIPVQVIAVNSVSLVSKVRFVASTLLDALSAPESVAGQEMDSKAALRSQKAQSYLWDFLRILSEIEALFSLKDLDEGS